MVTLIAFLVGVILVVFGHLALAAVCLAYSTGAYLGYNKGRLTRARSIKALSK